MRFILTLLITSFFSFFMACPASSSTTVSRAEKAIETANKGDDPKTLAKDSTNAGKTNNSTHQEDDVRRISLEDGEKGL